MALQDTDIEKISVVLVVAVSLNGVIGRDGAMPWHLPTDLKRFKALTLGCPVIMGRKTFESIGKALPARENIVVTRRRDFSADAIRVVPSFEEALSLGRKEAERLGKEQVCVIGGGDIYRQAMPFADILQVTQVETQIEGDTRFPAIDQSVFERVDDHILPKSSSDSHAMRAMTWRRRRPKG